jgi:hypothetical protein
VLFLSACAPSSVQAPRPEEPKPTSVAGEIERIVEVEAQGVVVHYQDESFWNEDEYYTILGNEDEFASELTRKFTNELSRHNKHAVNANVGFNKDNKSTILTCDVHGAITKRDHSYYAVFSWLLEPLSLDFINDDFKESENGLFWQGLVSGIPTTVIVRLPVIDSSVYKAWEHPIGHCHAHAWWEMEEK